MSKSMFEALMLGIGFMAIMLSSATLYYLGTAFIPGLLLFVPGFGLAALVLAPLHRHLYGVDWWEHGGSGWEEPHPALWQIASLSVVLVCLLLWGANPLVYFPGEVSLPIRYFPQSPASAP